MTRSERIQHFGEGTQRLLDTIAKYPKEFLSFKPAANKWSVVEIICHLADSETIAYTRFRRAIAEPGADVWGYDENAWANNLDYASHTIDEPLAWFAMVHNANHKFFASLADDQWGLTVNHSETGIIDLNYQVEHYDEHVDVHIRQIERNWGAWQAR
jgi:hypothetical protein